MHPSADAGIRRATPADIAAIAAIEDRAFTGDRFSRRQIRYLVHSPHCDAWVATEPDQPIAGYALVIHRANWRHGRLYSIAVDPDCRGRGIGGRLLDAAAAGTRDRGRGLLRLEVRADNRGAIRLYTTHGYQVIGGRADYYSDGMAAICMQKNLTAEPPLASPTQDT